MLTDFSANAAWAVLAAISQNILRAVGALASLFHARARGATLRRDLISVPASTARTGRGDLTLRGIAGWYAEEACLALRPLATSAYPDGRLPHDARATDDAGQPARILQAQVRVMTSLSDGRIPQTGPIVEAELAS